MGWKEDEAAKKAAEDKVLMKRIAIIGSSVVGTLFLGITTCSSAVIIEGGSRGVLTKLGKIDEQPLGEGFHVVIPFVSRVEKINLRVNKVEVQASAGTKDLQSVNMKVAVNYTIDPSKVVQIYRKVGDARAVADNIVAPINQEVIKSNASLLDAEELLTKRQLLKTKILEDLTQRLSTEGIIVQDASVADIVFSEEFNKAIEAKQIASQNAQKARYLAEQATNEAAAAIAESKGKAESAIEISKGRASAVLTEAQAQAKANALLRESLTPALLQKLAIEKWDGAYPTTVLGDKTVPMIQIHSSKKSPVGNKVTKDEEDEEAK